MAEIRDLPATGASERMGRRALSLAGIPGGRPARIGRVNRDVNAVVTGHAARLRSEVGKAGDAVMRGDDRGSPYGLPRRHQGHGGDAHRLYGETFHADHVPERDTGIVARLPAPSLSARRTRQRLAQTTRPAPRARRTLLSTRASRRTIAAGCSPAPGIGGWNPEGR